MTLEPVVSIAMASTVLAADAGCGDRLAGGGDERGHVVGVALGGVVGIVLLAMERIVGCARPERPLLVIEDGDPDAERAEVDACDERHKSSS